MSYLSKSPNFDYLGNKVPNFDNIRPSVEINRDEEPAINATIKKILDEIWQVDVFERPAVIKEVISAVNRENIDVHKELVVQMESININIAAVAAIIDELKSMS